MNFFTGTDANDLSDLVERQVVDVLESHAALAMSSFFPALANASQSRVGGPAVDAH